MSEKLPVRADLDWYRKAAKKKLKAIRAKKPSSKLADAQLAVARQHGFFSWRKLVASIGTAAAKPLDPSLEKLFGDALHRDRGDIDTLRKLLDDQPALVDCHPFAPQSPQSAIEAAADLCVWHRAKMVEIVQLLLDCGARCDLPTVARAGMIDEVKRRLDADPSLLDQPDANGRTALYRAACKSGYLKDAVAVIDELLKRGAKIDIFTACSLLMIEKLRSLLNEIPSLAKARDAAGLTALHWVTRTDSKDKRQIEAARLLLDAGANVEAEATGDNGMRPLHCAAEWASSIELAGLLLDRGAPINARSSQSPWTALDYAIDRNRESMRDFLRSRGGKTRQELAAGTDTDADDFLALVARDDLDAVRGRLVQQPDLVHRVGKHPSWGGRAQALHVSIERGNKAMFDLLLDNSADPDGDNALYDHWSPLMLANLHKRTEMRDELVRRVDHLSLIDSLMMADDALTMKIFQSGEIMLQRPMPNDATMLHFARTPVAAARLIELGVSIHAKDKYGKTPLDLAAEGGHRALVDLLRQHGASASLKAFARLGDIEEIARQLGRKKPTADLLPSAIQGGQLKLVRWLIERNADVNQADDMGITPLHLAAWDGNLPIVKLLVKHGADVHAEDEQYSATPTGWAQHAAQHFNRTACVAVTGYLQKQEEKKWSAKTLPAHRQTHKIGQWKPIMDAAFVGDAAQIKKLIKAGVDPNAISTTPGAHRPLHRAIEEKKTAPRGPRHEAAVKALLAGGADPHLRGSYDRLTALQLAAVDSPRFVPLLIDHFKPLDFLHACALLDLPRMESLLKKDKSFATRLDENGYSPLHYVAKSNLYLESPKHAANQLAMATLLVESGADPNASYAWSGPGHWPISVLYMCCGRVDNAAMTELLMKAGANACDNESVYHAADEGHTECLAVIGKYTDRKSLAEECTKSLRTQMHWGRSRGAKWLLEHGADPNSLHPQFGNSALHQAAVLGSNDRVIKLLLKHGGDPSVRNAKGKSAIELAVEFKKRRVAGLFQGLIS